MLSGATAFFTLFSSAPILLIVTQLIGLLIGQEDTRNEVAKKLTEVLGNKTQDQIIHTLTALNERQ